MSNNKAIALDADSNHKEAMINKFTQWSGNSSAMTMVSSCSKTNSLGDHPSTSTYGFSITTLSKVKLQDSA